MRFAAVALLVLTNAFCTAPEPARRTPRPVPAGCHLPAPSVAEVAEPLIVIPSGPTGAGNLIDDPVVGLSFEAPALMTREPAPEQYEPYGPWLMMRRPPGNDESLIVTRSTPRFDPRVAPAGCDDFVAFFANHSELLEQRSVEVGSAYVGKEYILQFTCSAAQAAHTGCHVLAYHTHVVLWDANGAPIWLVVQTGPDGDWRQRTERLLIQVLATLHRTGG